MGSVFDRAQRLGKHFELIITDTGLVYRRTDEKIAAEARLDGIDVIRTNVPKEALSPEDTVDAYKALAQVERAFRSTKTVDLEIRPVFHWTAPRVRAHVFLCMLITGTAGNPRCRQSVTRRYLILHPIED